MLLKSDGTYSKGFLKEDIFWCDKYSSLSLRLALINTLILLEKSFFNGLDFSSWSWIWLYRMLLNILLILNSISAEKKKKRNKIRPLFLFLPLYHKASKHTVHMYSICFIYRNWTIWKYFLVINNQESQIFLLRPKYISDQYPFKTASELAVDLSEDCIYICFAHVPGYSSLNGRTDSPLARKQDLHTHKQVVWSFFDPMLFVWVKPDWLGLAADCWFAFVWE